MVLNVVGVQGEATAAAHQSAQVLKQSVKTEWPPTTELRILLVGDAAVDQARQFGQKQAEESKQ